VNIETDTEWVKLYRAPEGNYPYQDWEDGLKDKATKYKVQARIARIRQTGNLGRWKPVGGGVLEIALDFGAGYRIYAGRVGLKLILLLSGGDKRTQETDIANAKVYLADYIQSRSVQSKKGTAMSNAKN
jgi:putative addiction module killer protein